MCEVVGDFIEAGGRGAQDARDELDAVRIPVVGVVADAVAQGGRHRGLVDAEEAGVLGEVPVGKIHPLAVFA